MSPSHFADLPWSQPSTIEATGVHHGYSTVSLIAGSRMYPGAERFKGYLTGPVEWAVISRLDPGGYLLPHRDKGPYYTRTHIPLEPGGWYWDEEVGAVQMELGVHVVRHHLTHAVWNDTDHPRVHLVIDRHPVHGDGAFGIRPDACPELTRFLIERIKG